MRAVEAHMQDVMLDGKPADMDGYWQRIELGAGAVFAASLVRSVSVLVKLVEAGTVKPDFFMDDDRFICFRRKGDKEAFDAAIAAEREFKRPVMPQETPKDRIERVKQIERAHV